MIISTASRSGIISCSSSSPRVNLNLNKGGTHAFDDMCNINVDEVVGQDEVASLVLEDRR